ncbi:MAG: PD-(D/E)XK nuclease family protein [Gemmatimonadota bacterium]
MPYDLSGGGSLQGSPELAALVDLLEAVARPDDPVPLLGYLRGPLVGLADDELLALRRAGGRLGWLEPLPAGLAPELAARLDAAWARLAEARQWLQTRTPAAAVEHILDAAGLLAGAVRGAAGSSRAGSLLRVLALVRQWQAGGRVAHWGAVLAELRALAREEGYRIEAMTLEIGQPEAVRLMNLHQAKGLEARAVFLADPCDTAHTRHGVEVRVARAGDHPHVSAVACRARGPHAREVIAEPEGWPEDEAREGAFTAAEELRLVYVAATRARDLLVVSVYGDGGDAGPWGALSPALAEAPDLPDPAGARPGPAPVPAVDRAAIEGAWPARWRQVAVPSGAVRPVTDAEGAAEVDLRGDGGRGREYGTVVHRLLEAAVAGRLPEDVKPYAECLATEAGVPTDLAVEAAAAVAAFRASDLWREVAAAPEVYAEVPFADVSAAAGGAPGPEVVRGVIDLIYRVEGGWTIVDYKTERPEGGGAGALQGRYGPQVRAYAAHWRRLTGEPVVRAGLWTAELGFVVVEGA